MNNVNKQELLKKLEPFKRKAWIPVTTIGDKEIKSSKFSGKVFLKKGELWPVCPNCGKPMQLFIQLNINELPEEFKSNLNVENGLLQMFYCVSNEPLCECDCEAYFPFSKSTLLRIVSTEGDGNVIEDVAMERFFPAKTIISWNEVIDYPNLDELSELGIILNDEEEEIYEELQIPHCGDKLGGWPYWVQNIEYPSCPKCNKPMKLIFQIDSDNNLPYMFGDCGCGHITQCEEHKDVLAFGWACC